MKHIHSNIALMLTICALSSLPWTAMANLIEIIRNPDDQTFREQIVPLYQKYYEADKPKSEADIMATWDQLKRDTKFSFLVARDSVTHEFLGFMTLGQAPDFFEGPQYLHRTVLDSAFVKDEAREKEIYDALFAVAVGISKKFRSHRLIAKTDPNFYKQEVRLYGSNMKKFLSEDKENPKNTRLFYEYHLDME